MVVTSMWSGLAHANPLERRYRTVPSMVGLTFELSSDRITSSDVTAAARRSHRARRPAWPGRSPCRAGGRDAGPQPLAILRRVVGVAAPVVSIRQPATRVCERFAARGAAVAERALAQER